VRSAFDSNDCRIFAEALELAWEIFLKTGRLTSANVDIAKAALTRAMLEAAEKGERNTRRLAIAAVGGMARFEGKLRSERLHSGGRRSA
jgi:hypothetical protein